MEIRVAPEANVPVYKETYMKQRTEKLEELMKKSGFELDPETLPDAEHDYLSYDNEQMWFKDVSVTRRYNDSEGTVSTRQARYRVFVQLMNDLGVSDRLFHIYMRELSLLPKGADTSGRPCYEDNKGWLFSTNSLELLEALIVCNFDIER